MRRVHTLLKLREEHSSDTLLVSPLGDLTDISWPDAKRLAEGRDKPEFDWEEASRQKAEQWASLLGKAFGKEAGKHPEILAMALDIYDSRLADRLVDWWGDRSTEEE